MPANTQVAKLRPFSFFLDVKTKDCSALLPTKMLFKGFMREKGEKSGRREKRPKKLGRREKRPKKLGRREKT